VIFVDSSFWIGLTDVLDSRHAEAADLIRSRNRAQLLTTNHVLGETWTFLRKRHRHAIAMRFLDRVDTADRIDVRFVGAELERDAWDWLRQHDERSYSFVDATSFTLMRRLAIHEALAFEGDFAAAGFVELRA
jgi:uncharacterized protein